MFFLVYTIFAMWSKSHELNKAKYDPKRDRTVGVVNYVCSQLCLGVEWRDYAKVVHG